MKKLLMALMAFVLLGCDPLDKKYDQEKHEQVMADHADSASRVAFRRAMVENEVNDVRNEEFTYQELIDQGKALERKNPAVRSGAR
ncbi:hypothetical protein ACO2Q8_16925 [Larkinella sp. VNQ87]|uniref:hypothetical protein n=1 Tax=Larkinella sp. VNQ87 TaxID=3400921 RepID=UPI003BFD2D38